MDRVEQYGSENATIYYGDCFEVLAGLPDESVDLIFADPPYNIGKQFANFKDVWPSDHEYANWCYQWLELCIKKLKPQGSLYIMTSTQAMPYLDLWLREKLTILSRIVWYYDSSGVQARKYYGSLYEPILFCVKDYRKDVPTPYKSTKVPGNVWSIPRVRYRMSEYEEHPSQKPEALLERIIRASSHPGAIVLDPFAGTFTTCAVAQRLERHSIGIEVQEDYIKIGLRRLAIASHYKGEKLSILDKTYVRKNVNGVHGAAIRDQQGSLDGNI
jgi:adenine-specific DNA-methyltransferase